MKTAKLTYRNIRTGETTTTTISFHVNAFGDGCALVDFKDFPDSNDWMAEKDEDKAIDDLISFVTDNLMDGDTEIISIEKSDGKKITTKELEQILTDKSGVEWHITEDNELYCNGLWNDPEVDADVTITENGEYEIRVPGTTEIFNLEDLLEFVDPEK